MKPNTHRRTFADVRQAEAIGMANGPAAKARQQEAHERRIEEMTIFVNGVVATCLMSVRRIGLGKIIAANVLNWHVQQANAGRPSRLVRR